MLKKKSMYEFAESERKQTARVRVIKAAQRCEQVKANVSAPRTIFFFFVLCVPLSMSSNHDRVLKARSIRLCIPSGGR